MAGIATAPKSDRHPETRRSVRSSTGSANHSGSATSLWAMVPLIASTVAAVAAGSAVSRAQPLCALALPPLVIWQATRLRAACISIAYFLSAGETILSVGSYLDMSGSPFPPACFWVISAALQSLVWVAVWGREARPLRTTLALVLSALPPLGVLSWAHPFHAAGILFPTTGLFGIALTLVLVEVIVFEPAAIVLPIVLAIGLRDVGVRPPPPSWAGMRTHFGDVFRGDDPLGVMDAVGYQIKHNDALVQVWPESVVPHWNDATQSFWSELLADARSRGKTIVLGSTISIPDPRILRLRNVAIIQGREEADPVDQRTPVPGGTWHPLTGEGVPLSLFKSTVRNIGGERAAFVICYEQLLSWTYIPFFVERPTLLIGMANVYWVQDTSIPAVQNACLKSWARLFDIPFVEAVNQ